jgi:hypothetical protein
MRQADKYTIFLKTDLQDWKDFRKITTNDMNGYCTHLLLITKSQKPHFDITASRRPLSVTFVDCHLLSGCKTCFAGGLCD